MIRSVRRFGWIIGLWILVIFLPSQAQGIYVKSVEDRDHVTVMEIGGVYDRQPEANLDNEIAVRQAVAREFFRTHADDYDFLVIFTSFPYDLGNDAEGGQVGGRYYAIKNDVQGIGQDLFDLSEFWGSQGRLQGYIDMRPLSQLAVDPSDPGFEQTLSTLTHEMAHRWAAHVRFKDTDGSLSTALLGREAAHWNFLLQSHNSVLYGNDWRDNGDGTFTSVGRSESFYSPLDLYLMGMIDKTQVPPFFMIENSEIDQGRLPEVGVTITGTRKVITIEDIIAAEGERVPSAHVVPRQFKIAFIYLVLPDDRVEGIELTGINAIRESFATREIILTGGQGVVQVYPEAPQEVQVPQAPILPLPSGPRVGPIDLTQGVNWLLSRQEEDGYWGDSRWTRVRDTGTVLELLREVPSANSSYLRGMAWLTGMQEFDNVDTVARRLMAIAPQVSPTDTSLLVQSANTSGGWGLRRHYRSDPLDTALALMALPQSDPSVQQRLSGRQDLTYLIDAQNEDGGWGLRPDGSSSVLTTLYVLQLGERYTDSRLSDPLSRALAWVKDRQNPDGGFGSSPSTVYETAQTVIFFAKTPSARPRVAAALDYLRDTQLADGSWNESIYETALAIRALKTGELPNALVVASGIQFSPGSPVEGETVSITAQVFNDGVQDISDLGVRFFNGDPANGGFPIGSDSRITFLPASGQTSIQVIWDTTGNTGERTIFVVVDPDHRIEESNEMDNPASKGINVRSPPVGSDLRITSGDMALTPSMLQSVPQEETLTARIFNIGQTGATQAGVSLHDGDPASGGTKIAEGVADIPGRGSAILSLTFAVVTVAEHRFFLIVDPANEVPEDDEGNNQASLTLPVQGTVDLFVSPGSVSFSENPIGIGRDVTISAVVGNQGTSSAYTVPVRFFVDDPRGAIDLGIQILDMAPGVNKPVSILYRTDRPMDQLPVVVQIDPANTLAENSENNNQGLAQLTVLPSSEANLQLSYQELHVTAPVKLGGTAIVSIPVHNNGFAYAAGVEVAFFIGVPGSGGVQIGVTQTIPFLPPGTQETVSVIWDPITTSGNKLIYVMADPSDTVAEFDEEDNEAFVTVKVFALPDLSINGGAIVFSPLFPRGGEPVVINATVTNKGDQAASGVRVRFFDGDPAAGGGQIGFDQIIPQIPGLGQATAQGIFDATATLGVHTIYVQVDPLDEIREGDETDNIASKTLGIQDASLWFSYIYFSPNGDGVQDTTELFYRFTDALHVQGAVVYNRKGEKVRTIDLGQITTSGSIPWDGRDDLGRIVPDGDYAVSLLAPDGREFGIVWVVVDNNRSLIGDAIGTKYLMESNLTCSLDQEDTQGTLVYQNWGWLPDDSGLLMSFPKQWWCDYRSRGYFGELCTFRKAETAVGVYIVSSDGKSVTRITPDNWAELPQNAGQPIIRRRIASVQISPDGSRLLVLTIPYQPSYRSSYPYQYGVTEDTGPWEFWTMNTDGSGLTLAATQNGYARYPSWYAYQPGITWAPDSRRFAYTNFDNYQAEYGKVLVAEVDGSGQSVAWDAPEGEVAGSVSWSPDSRRLVFNTTGSVAGERLYTTNLDGTGRQQIGSGYFNVLDYWFGPDRTVVQGTDNRLWAYDLTVGSPVLLSGSLSVGAVAWSPDGRRGALIAAGLAGFNPWAEVEQEASGIWLIDDQGGLQQVYSASPQNRGIEGLAWSADGQTLAFVEYVVAEHRICNDEGSYFCGSFFPALVVIDVEASTVIRYTLDKPRAGVWTGRYLLPVTLSLDGQSYLFLESGDKRLEDGDISPIPPWSLIAVRLSDGTHTRVLDDPYASSSVGDYRFSPSGKMLLYKSSLDSHEPSSPCWNGSSLPDQWALTSFLNLTVEFAFQREGSQLLIRGTAEDLNFKNYRLEYAPVATPDHWTLIAQEDTPLINGVLARWIPPAEGSFYVRLTGEDRAGNQRTVRRRITWGLTPTITNVSILPRVFSPNGDGAKDTITIDYLVLGPVHLEFAVYDAQNTHVRTMTQDHAVMGPASIAWDGRDDAGQFVGDGIYRIHVLDYDFFAMADTIPPDVGVSIGTGFHTIPHQVHCQMGMACVDLPGPLVETPYHVLSGHVKDEQIARWTLEVGEGVNPAEWVFVDEGTDLKLGLDSAGVPKTPIADVTLRRLDQPGDVVGKKFRLIAVDQAGNRATSVADLAPQEIILHAWDGVPVPTTLTIEQRLGAHILSVLQTVRVPLQIMRVQYRLQGTTVWVDGPAVSLPLAQVEFHWDNALLFGGRTYEVRVVGKDFDGNQVGSNLVTIHSDLFVLTSVDHKQLTTFGIASLRETLTDIQLVVALPGDEEIGDNPIFSTATDFSIRFPCRPDGPTVPVRYKGIGQSGRLYYSNSVTVITACSRKGGGADGGLPFGSSLKLSVQAPLAPDCGAQTSGRTDIFLSGVNVIEGSQKLFIQEAPNGLLKEVAGATLPFALQLQTGDKPEGTYLVRATASFLIPDLTTGELSATGSFVVDRVPPTGRITYPGTNQTFCPVKSGTSVIVPVEGIAEDANFDHYELDYGFGENPQLWITVFPAPANPIEKAASETPKRGILANWDVTDLPSGTYSLRLKVYDQGGNIICHTISFFLEGTVRLQRLTADRKLISPNGDGNFDGVTLTYTIDKNAWIDARVYPVLNDQPGTPPVRTILLNAQELPGTNSFLWDGLSDLGVPVPNGGYTVVVTATDICTNGVEARVQVEVDNTPPEAVITSPQTTDTLGVLVDVKGSASDLHFQSYLLEVGPTDAPVNWTSLASGLAPIQNNLLGKWNNQGQAGIYTLRLTAKDGVGNQQEARMIVTVPQITQLVSNLAAQPTLFSPNSDGKLDTTSFEYAIGADAQVLLEIVDGSGTTIRTLLNGSSLPMGSHTVLWNGASDAGVKAPDGDYLVRIIATATANPAQTQTEKTTVKVDVTPPTTAPDSPADVTFLKGDVPVSGTLSDLNIDSYSLTYGAVSGGPTVTLDQGNQSRTSFTFGTLKGLADGNYTLKWEASDLAQNSARKTTTFTLDNTLPMVTLTAPTDGALVGGTRASVAIKGTVAESNLREWTLRFGSGADPQSWTTITTQTTLPALDLLATWDVGTLADGPYALSLLATDKAGSTFEVRLSVIVDNSPPTAAISQPTEGARINAPIPVIGYAADAHLTSALLELSEGEAPTAFKYVPLVSLTSSVAAGALFQWQALPSDGTYTLRLTVEDEVGLKEILKRTVKIDTQPPEPPTNLTAPVENKKNARLNWLASPEPELAGYNVYRDGKKINGTIVVGTTYLDENLSDGTYLYKVTTVDLATLESVPSNEAQARLDLTPPVTRIQSPANGAVVWGIIDIRGNAGSDDFKEYRVFTGEGIAPISFTLIRRSPAPVTSELLTQWDTIALAEGGFFTIRLETEDLAGNLGSDQVTVKIDNLPPAAPVLLSASPTGPDINIQWQANTESDLAGYLLYNIDILANARRIVSGSVTPYLIAATSFADNGLPDGEYKYYLFAVDKAGNISNPSNTLTVIVETRPPRATITQPMSGTKTEKPILIAATSTDQDIARVQFQFKAAAESIWTDMGSPVTAPPYQVTLAPAGLAYGSYNFRAVATDVHNNSDPAPATIIIIYQDLTPPVLPMNLSVKVMEGTSALTWSANADTDLAGYFIYRATGQGTPGKLFSTPISKTTYDDLSLDDDHYTYTVTAVDTSGNESGPSNAVTAHVYTPLTSVPNICLPDPGVSLSGTGAEPGSTVTLFIDTGTGPEASGTVQSADGTFQFDGISLVLGTSLLSVQAVSPAGNASNVSSPLPVKYDPVPPVPTGFLATVNGFDVSMGWDAADPDLLGYKLYRSGILVNPTADATAEGTTSASSTSYYDYSPYNVVDGDINTFWFFDSYSDPTPWWQLEFAQVTLVKEIIVDWYSSGNTVYGASDFEVQGWDGGKWVILRKFQGNTQAHNIVTLPNYALASKVRVLITNGIYGLSSVYLTEVKVYKQALISGASYADSALTDGTYTYQLAAVNACGVEGASAHVTAAVGDVVAPASPLNLTASVSGSDVSLQWIASTGPDLTGYNLFRSNGGSIWGKVNAALISGTVYLDSLLPNGSYLYQVTAVDSVGNESAPSNEAPAVVNVSLPQVPIQLSVGAPPEGGSLDVAWVTGDPTTTVAGYHIFRGLASGGPYVQVNPNLVAATSYQDMGLTNGVSYYYVVRAVDLVGNIGYPSNEGSGVPNDPVLPSRPILLYPTGAARPRTMTTDTTPIAGTAEPGSTVELLSQGLSLGTIQSLWGPSSDSFNLPSASNSTVSFYGPESLLASFSTPPGESQSVLTLTDVVRHVTQYVNSVAEGDNPIVTSDGQRIAYTGYNGVGYQLYFFDRRTGAVSPAIDLPGAISDTAFSPDGTKIAFTFNDQIWTADLDGSGSIQLTTDSDYYPVWSPDGATIFYINITPAGSSLRRIDLASGNIADIDTNAVAEPPVFSPDGKTMAFASLQGGKSDLWLDDLATGTLTPIPPGSDFRITPLFTPDGSGLVYLEFQPGAALYGRLLNFATGEILHLGEITVENRPFWASDGALVQFLGDKVMNVLLPGHFQFDLVLLNGGDNVFSAIAIDAAGNTSLPADPITLTLDTSGMTDLSIGEADLFVYPLIPNPGESVRVAATIHNPSAIPVNDVEVVFFDRNAAGGLTQVGSLQKIPSLGHGETASLFVDWSTTGLSGRHALVVIVDPLGKIEEISETNNSAQSEVLITSGGTPALSISTDRASYPAAGIVRTSVDVTNPAPAADFTLDIAIEDRQGFHVASLLHETISFFGYSSRNFTPSWPDTNTLAGAYQVHAVLTRADGERFDSTAPFTIVPEQQAVAKVATDRTTYLPGDAVHITGIVRNTSTNADLTGLTTLIQVMDQTGGELFRIEGSLPTLLLGAQTQEPTLWTASSQGNYTVRLAVSSGEGELASSTATFNVIGVVKMEGRLAVVPAVIPVGAGFALSAEAANTGTLDATGVTLRLLMIDPDQQAVVRSFQRVLDLPAGGTVSWDIPGSSLGLGLKTYTTLLQAEASPVQNLASGTLSVVDQQAPVVEITSPLIGAYYNSDVSFTAYSTDDASGVDKVELSLDGGPWAQMSPSDLASGRYSMLYTVTSGTDGAHALSIRASDKAGNNDQTSSSDLNPVLLSFTVDVTPPIIMVSGVTEGANYSTPVTPIITMTDASPFTNTISMNGVSFISGTVIDVDGRYVLEITAEDQAGNRASRLIHFTLAQNLPPVASAGADKTVRWGETVTLDGTGSADPDGDVLTYLWVQTAGPPVTISNNSVAQPTFVTPSTNTEMVMTFDLTVADPHGASSTDGVNITIHADLALDRIETLGPPFGITIASGSGIAAGGTGMVKQPGTITVDVPAGSIVKQVLLYWDGQSIGPVPGDDMISVNGIAVTGNLIGGPAYFFDTTYNHNLIHIWPSSFRADITSLNLITPGFNTLTVDGMSFNWANNGAGVLVIYDDGLVTSDIQVRDGLDLAFINFPEPRRSTVPQTFYITPAGVDRTAQVLFFVGSVHDDRKTITTYRPNSIELNVTVGGVITTYVYSNYLGSNDGLYWDSLMLDVLIPSGATDLTIQVFSRDDVITVSGNLPASLEWVGGMVSVPPPPLPDEANLSITKTALPEPVTVGQNLTYTITVANNGPGQATGVTVTDTLPLGVAYVSAVPSQGSCIGTSTVTCSIGSLSAGGSATISIVVTTLWNGIVSNSSSVTGAESDPDTGNNFTSVVSTVSPLVDLSVTKTDSPDPVYVGDSLLYTITVTNNGPSDATGVTVTDTLPAGVDYVSATPSQGSCSGTVTVTCSLGNLVNGASATVMIVVTPTVAGTLNNSASVTGNEDDPDISDNTTSVISTTVNTPPSPDADLSIIKTDSPDPVLLVGDSLTYTITVTNNGPSSATGVTVIDTLPAEVSFVSITPSQGTCGGTSSITCNIGSLASGGSVTITIVTQTLVAQMVGNTANVTGNENDSVPGNNSATTTTNVGDLSRLINISTRGPVQTGDNVMIGGFILGGILPKTILIRGFGPTLADFGVTGTMANPYLELYSGPTLIATNDNWQTPITQCDAPATSCGTPQDIQATGKSACQVATTGCSQDAVILATLPPGAYTAILTGVEGGTGVGMIGVDDPDTSTAPKLVNISSRGKLLTGDSVMIGGFIIGAGSSSMQVLIRAMGPTLADFGVTGAMADPYIELYSGQTRIAANDNWQTPITQCDPPAVSCGTPVAIQATGKDSCTVATTGCAQDAAILVTLPPGAYTAIVRGVGGSTGVGLVGIDELGQ